MLRNDDGNDAPRRWRGEYAGVHAQLIVQGKTPKFKKLHQNNPFSLPSNAPSPPPSSQPLPMSAESPPAPSPVPTESLDYISREANQSEV